MQQDENPPTQDLSERRCRQPRCSSGGSEPSIALGCSGLASQSTPPDGIKTVCVRSPKQGAQKVPSGHKFDPMRAPNHEIGSIAFDNYSTVNNDMIRSNTDSNNNMK